MGSALWQWMNNRETNTMNTGDTTMRRLLTIVLAAGLAGLGCNSTGKKPSTAKPTGKSDPTPFWSEGNNTAKGGPSPAPSAAVSEGEGILAGLLIDAYGKPAPKAVINVAPADAGPNAKPIGIEADEQGYFLIKGLKPGISYFLSVRGEESGRAIGGSALTAAPNTRMLIRLSEGNVSSVTPGPQPHPATTGPFAQPEKKDAKDGKPKLDDPPTGNIPNGRDPLLDSQDQSWGPGKTPPTSRPAPPPPAPSNNPNVADNGNRNGPPILSVPGPSGSRIEPPPPPASPAMTAVPSNSSPIVGIGAIQERPEQAAPRINFTLYDLGGNGVEFRHLTDRRLIVMDFWSTTCMPCLRKVPELIDFQSRYSNYVEVVGVVCDMTAWNQRTKDVMGIKDYYLRKAQKPINYPLYLEGQGQEGRIQTMFNIKAYPTMVVLDHNGKERWRGSDVKQLEDAIKFILQRP